MPTAPSNPKPAAGPDDRPAPPRKVDVFYHPADVGDPPFTEWHGHRFRAGEPVTVDPSAASNRALFESLPGNRYFSCPDLGIKRERPHARKAPETSDELRGHTIDWVNASTDPDAMVSRWESEEGLRQRCGWGTADDDFIRPIYDPKLYELRQAQRGTR